MFEFCQSLFKLVILLNQLLIFLLLQKSLKLINWTIQHFFHRLFWIFNHVIECWIIQRVIIIDIYFFKISLLFIFLFFIVAGFHQLSDTWEITLFVVVMIIVWILLWMFLPLFLLMYILLWIVLYHILLIWFTIAFLEVFEIRALITVLTVSIFSIHIHAHSRFLSIFIENIAINLLKLSRLLNRRLFYVAWYFWMFLKICHCLMRYYLYYLWSLILYPQTRLDYYNYNSYY